jgi:RNA polymerase sigma-70 factor (ECF subfamily)
VLEAQDFELVFSAPSPDSCAVPHRGDSGPKSRVSHRYGSTLELGALYREHADLIERWALRLGGPGADAEDVVHDVFLIAHRRLRDFRGEAKITTWLYRITERVVRRKVRRQRIRQWLKGLSRDYANDIPSEGPGPSENFERLEASRIVYAALDRIGHAYRTAVILYELEGLSGEEIAEFTGTKLSTVWVRLHRGRAKFLDELKRIRECGSC